MLDVGSWKFKLRTKWRWRPSFQPTTNGFLRFDWRFQAARSLRRIHGRRRRRRPVFASEPRLIANHSRKWHPQTLSSVTHELTSASTTTTTTTICPRAKCEFESYRQCVDVCFVLSHLVDFRWHCKCLKLSKVVQMFKCSNVQITTIGDPVDVAKSNLVGKAARSWW